MALTPKQKEFYQYIVSYHETHGHAPTQKEIKEHFALKSFGSVQKYLQYLIKEGLLEANWNERRGIQLQEHKLLKEVKKDVHQTLQNYQDFYQEYHQKEYQKEHNESITLPLLGDIAAGVPIEAIENAAEKITVPKSLFPMLKPHERYFALTVKGDSMINSGIIEGDVVIIKHQKTAHPKDIVAAQIDNEVTLKTFSKEKDRVALIASNPKYAPIIVDGTRPFDILGILVGLVRAY